MEEGEGLVSKDGENAVLKIFGKFINSIGIVDKIKIL